MISVLVMLMRITVDTIVEIKHTMFELFLLRVVRFVCFVFLCQ